MIDQLIIFSCDHHICGKLTGCGGVIGTDDPAQQFHMGSFRLFQAKVQQELL